MNDKNQVVAMDEGDVVIERFELSRRYLTSVAYNMLGSVTEAEDAVQECWLRLNRSNAGAIDNVEAWLTTVVGRICLDMLRARKSRREDYAGTWLPEPVVTEEQAGGQPEQQTVLADSVGLALLVVMESLSPPERLAFVLHDIFALPFEEIGQVIDRSPEAARQLASRARRRLQTAPRPDTDVAVQRRVVDAFLAAARGGDFDGLVAVLDPDVEFHFDLGVASRQARPPVVGAEAVARQVLSSAPRFINLVTPVMVNGAAGALFGPRERPISVVGFTVVGGRITAINLVADPAKLGHLRLEP